jgi:quercetin dioxygenase-like cupin family protein
MKRTFALLSVAALTLVAASVRAAAPAAPTVVPASAVKWVAGTGDSKGTWSAVLYGDPTKAGAQYASRLKIPDGGKFGPHTHGLLEQVTVLSGTLLVGLGTKWDDKKLTVLPTGSFVAIPAKVPHFAAAKGETVLELHGVGPASMTMIKGAM